MAKLLARIKVLIDRLHVRGHTACKPTGSHPLPEVQPLYHKTAFGNINSQSCEQTFAFVTFMSRIGRYRSPLTRVVFLHMMLDMRNRNQDVSADACKYDLENIFCVFAGQSLLGDHDLLCLFCRLCLATG